MKNISDNKDIWVKSSVLGSLWASSEIILGSFLHNLKVPFSGNFLAAIGVIILISVSYKWKKKGLFWRSGLICAIMKSMSPSAVIFGPMIAIFTEAVLLEITVRIFGRNYFGFILGASLAMLWTLFQKIINLIIFYGPNLVELYTNLLIYTQKQLKIEFDIVWFPILLFALIGIIFGIISTIIGVKAGKKALKSETNVLNFENKSDKNIFKKSEKSQSEYSFFLLIFNILSIIMVLILMNFSIWYIWLTIGFSLIIFWILKYKRTLNHLKKPKFWILFLLITMFSALIFSKFIDSSNGYLSGLLIGLEMNFRATVVILGFSVIGTELYNPKIKEIFSKSRFNNLHSSLELAFETLPMIIVNIPEFKNFFKNKYSFTNHLVNIAEIRFEQLNKIQIKRTIIISGKNNEGKTTYLHKLYDELKDKNIEISGFISLKIFENNEFAGYNLFDLKTQKTLRLARLSYFENSTIFRKYFFDNEALSYGNNLLKSINPNSNQIVFIDEIGIWETENEGWAEGFNFLINSGQNLIFSCRNEFVDVVTKSFGLDNFNVFNIAENAKNEIINLLLKN